MGLRRKVAVRLDFFHYTLPVRSLHTPLSKLMQHLASLAVLLLVLAPLVSRTSGNAHSFLESPLCQSRTTQADAAPGLVVRFINDHRFRISADAGAVNALPGIKHDMQGAATQHASVCDYCGLAARLLPWLLIALVVFALIRARRASERCVAVRVCAARWWAHSPRGPPLFA
ncbi:DUF2946 family protein [Xanthomonas hortorum]|uniref:DUF2946 family protein n=1 Tax=Xanthomonas hortorum TaxID=56454 RepID=UPI000AF58F2D|nr:DUF2946 family protein [Xanthomonas hortorum]MCC8500301.1 DUF2946 family protein [Xanthomonas hortorum pv. gardneri]MCC8508797.1 DUF2946 family protein [Xanthomonas hortorum pv. gardneri]MCC8513003.1 DUF2946 family protein [Xanthomonas hortorum pv. gardneri]MCC8521927.1 DUF2946 family protein [Xanthomonas hortorum pv. gardneri]MCC8526105.1 DUF2946 family protein [Xanthomonas hortorum pv. gardneri]